MADLTLDDLLRQFQPTPQEQQQARMQALATAGFALLGTPKGREWQGLGNAGLAGMNALTQTQLLNEQMRRQRLLEGMQSFKLAKDVEATNAGLKMLGIGAGLPPSGTTPSGPPTIGAVGGASVAPPPGVPASSPTPSQLPQIGLSSPQPWATPQAETAFAVMGKKDIADVIHRQYQIVQGPGNTLIRNGQVVGQVIPNAGMVLDGAFVPLPKEATDAMLAMKRAEAGIASEQELVDIPTTLPGGQPGPTLKVRKSDALSAVGRPAPPPSMGGGSSLTFSPNMTPSDVMAAFNDYRASLGNQGAMPARGIGAPTGAVSSYGVQASPLAVEAGKAAINTSALAQQEVNKGAISQIDKQYENVANSATNGIPLVHEARSMLDSGKVITGKGANFATSMGGWLTQVGFKQAEDPTANTQAFAATQARQVLTIIKSLGSGSGISDADREYAAKIVGGDITMTEPALRRLLDISERAQRNSIAAHNDRVQRAARVFQNSDLQQLYTVEPPAPYVRPSAAGFGLPTLNEIQAEKRRRQAAGGGG